MHAEENKRRTLQKSDIATAVSKSDMYDFLIDIVPRDLEMIKATAAASVSSVTTTPKMGGGGQILDGYASYGYSTSTTPVHQQIPPSALTPEQFVAYAAVSTANSNSHMAVTAGDHQMTHNAMLQQLADSGDSPSPRSSSPRPK